MISTQSSLDIDTSGLYSRTYQPQFMVELQQNLFRFLPESDTSSSEKNVVFQPLIQEAKNLNVNKNLKLDEKKIIRLYKQKLSQRMIAEKFNCNRDIIGQILKKNDIKSNHRKIFNQEKINRIIYLYNSKYSTLEIGIIFDCYKKRNCKFWTPIVHMVGSKRGAQKLPKNSQIF